MIAAFESNLDVEIALEKLKSNDIDDNRIVVVEMKMNTKDIQIMDTIYHSNGISLFDGIAAWAVMGTLKVANWS